MENTQKAHLRTEAEREEFLRKDKQPWLDGYFLGSSSQQSSLDYKYDDSRAKDLHRAVLEHLIVDVKPFSTVEGRGFVKMQNTFHRNFKLGSSKFYREKMVKVYDLARSQIKEKIERDQPLAFSAQLDGWSALQHGYLGLIVSYITSSWKRVQLNLALRRFDVSHKGEVMATWLSEELEEWKIQDKTFTLVTDSAANNLKMMEYLDSNISHLKCLNHVLNTVVEKDILESSDIKGMILQVRKVSNYHSNLFAEDIRQKCKKQGRSTLKLIKDVATRWNSTHDMLKRFSELEKS